uniref:Monoterepene synthase TPS1, chloropastic n=1 Tax=Cananga odorata TaxID=13393 RepID=TPS1_CANOD|nr:RecName: Full=Monoterepene synthase TPS1, chloropastic; AltName: Full=Alpha-terpinene synthase TPS1; AltName: Full=Beta-pinene synthase TPS1; AltName: Full=Beta-thujene synthase TPS1; AltName: Full=Sabinene synthase TPS1; AltName: Full=Terpene synthase 1; Short=CoTPS1; Flags: Precursor [Cananga odorata]QMW48842.1 terpene synthase 1 [Cananga odorata]
MALNTFLHFPPCSLSSFSCAVPKLPLAIFHKTMARQIRCPRASSQTSEPALARRSANFQPTIWTNDFIQSLNSDYSSDVYVQRIEKLKKSVRQSLEEADGPLAQLELIDDLQRLGVGRLFEREINEMLNGIYMDYKETQAQWNLHFTSMYFRLLRARGFDVSPEIFSRFMDETGNFQTSISNDPIGMLSLYEASYLCMPGETTLDEAQAFTCKHLKYWKEKDVHPTIALQIEHALELPIHWRMPRLDSRWYIKLYEEKEGTRPLLLELAKLDFNMVQSAHQTELRKVSRWWSEFGLAEKASFARDRLMEGYQWAIGTVFEPEFGQCREVLAKLAQLIAVIDDMYDVYGSPDELELFTDAVDRWNINTIEGLPDYMKLCFLSIYNTTNQGGYEFLKDHGVDIIPHLRKAWADYCKALRTEARWVNSKYTPTLDEYLNNAYTSASGPLILIHAFFFSGQEPWKEAIDCFVSSNKDIIRLSATIFRLTDDLETSAEEIERGDVPKSIQCYMHEAGASEAVSRAHIRGKISEVWRKMNKYLTAPATRHKTFNAAAFNLARTSTCVYLYGDGYGVPNGKNKENITSLTVEPIVLE